MADGLDPLTALLSGSSTLFQIFAYQVVGQVMQALLSPYVLRLSADQLSAAVNGGQEVQPIPFPDLADMLERGRIGQQEAVTEALKSGFTEHQFLQMYANVGEPPGVDEVAVLARRGILPWTGPPGEPSFEEAVRTSRVMTWWTDVLKTGQTNIPATAADFNNAYLRAQIDAPTWLAGMAVNGINEETARMLYNTSGRPAAPMQAAELVRRGVIPVEGTGVGVSSFQNAIYEGDTKPYWWEALSALIEDIPGVFEIRLMQSSGGVSADVAAKYYRMLGLPADLIQGMVAAGSGQKLAGSKQLALSVVENLYHDGLIDRATAVAFVEKLGYSQQEADYVIEVQDLKLTAETETAAIAKVRASYLVRKIEAGVAQTVLLEEGLDAATATRLIHLWEDERAVTIRVLTPGEIATAVYYGSRTVEQGLALLEGDGYTASDAWVVLADRLHSAYSTAAGYEAAAAALAAAQPAAPAA